jgi:predicted nuclease of restriction endonuclease-like (RecB) superfamily
MKKTLGTTIASPEYGQFIEALKGRVASAWLSAARAVNRDVILLYWDIGQAIAEKQEKLGWGDSVVEMVARDLRQAFPSAKGFSPQNVWRMLQFYRTHTASEFLSQLVRELDDDTRGKTDATELSRLVREMVAAVPWGHHANVLAKVAAPAARLYYLRATAQFGWTRNVLLNQIKAGAYQRSLKEGKTHNFALALPEHLAEQAEEMMKSSFHLEFRHAGRQLPQRGCAH